MTPVHTFWVKMLKIHSILNLIIMSCFKKNYFIKKSAQFGSREVGDVWRFLFFSDFNTPVNRTDSCPAYREVRHERNGYSLHRIKCV